MELIKFIENVFNENPDKIYNIKDFAFLGNVQKVKQCFENLVKENKIIKLIKGFFIKYKILSFSKTIRIPGIEQIANVIALNNGWKILPSGENLLNKIGLSLQVPSEYIFLSSGPSSQIEFQGTKIIFLHNKITKTFYQNNKLNYLITAIKYIGEKSLDSNQISKVIKFCKENPEILFEDLKEEPTWVYNLFNQIKGELKKC